MPEAYQKLGRYRLFEEIASGGMATVYRAKLIGVEGFEKEFAVKKILPYWSQNKDFIKMLIEEAKVLVHLHHKNIVQVFELAKEEATYFIAMEYISGLDLKRLLKFSKDRKALLPLPLAIFLLKEICAGLHFAHHLKAPVIHRDISPQNILLSFHGEVKITDFGIAKMLTSHKKTHSRALKGKFSYMSPEQASGKFLNTQSDLFSLGIVFYEMLTGQKCFDGDTDLEILEKVKHVEVEIPKHLPEDIQNILKHCLQKNLEDRYQNSLEILKDLESFEKKEKIQTKDSDLILFLKGVPQQQERIEAAFPKTKILRHTDLPIKNEPKTIVLVKTVLTQFKKRPAKKISLFKASFVLLLLGLPFFFFKIFPEKTESVSQTKPAKKERFTELAIRKTTEPRAVLARLTIFAKPEGAKISIKDDTNSYMTKTILEKTFSLKDNTELHLEVSHDGFLTQTKTITLSPQNKNHVEHITLERIPYGQIHIEARPWALIRLQNEERITPTRFEKVPAGKQTLQLFFPPKNQTLTEEVFITSNETLNCRASFAKKASLVCR